MNAQGIHTSPRKVQAVSEARSPQNRQELRSIVGLINYYGKFIPDLASILHPLHALLRANQPWSWSNACEKAFQKVKKAPILAHYDPELPLVLAADASAYGLGAVLSHRFANGSERPVAYASRTLTSSEKNYPQVEKEALSLVFAIKKFHPYIYGRHFTLLTDHQPLTSILGSKRGVPTLVAARMQRWALLLTAYTYDFSFRPTEMHSNADCLSRLPIAPPVSVSHVDEASVFNTEQLHALPVQATEVATATRLDHELSQVITFFKGRMATPSA